jgi:hypothetical protein
MVFQTSNSTNIQKLNSIDLVFYFPFILDILLFFFFINVGVQIILHAPRLIPQTLKLTTM